MPSKKLKEENRTVIEAGLKSLPNVSKVRYFKWTHAFGEYYEVKDTNDGVYRIGDRYAGVRCPFYEIAYQRANPNKRWEDCKECKLTEMAMASFWLETFYPILVAEDRVNSFADKMEQGEQLIADIIYQLFRKVTPIDLFFHENFSSIAIIELLNELIDGHHEFFYDVAKDELLLKNQPLGFKIKLSNDCHKKFRWLFIEKIYNVQKEQKAGFYLRKSHADIVFYLTKYHGINYQWANRLGAILHFCPANYDIFPDDNTIMTHPTMLRVLQQINRARDNGRENKSNYNHRGPRPGSNWTGD
tara:strand:- start:846 stop:1748 length:903 start_codon:yes stop_codon:yes gene_type:complete